ncbi:MAG: hypothetical protein HQL45_10915 [Alphaproteobacteria bacterium]|nr:hypothetical protein [Alphaproteobacteria bacterium]
MATKIESTVGTAAEDLAKAGLSGTRPVTMIVLDDEEHAKLALLRAAIRSGDASGDPLEAAGVFAELRHHLTTKNRKTS